MGISHSLIVIILLQITLISPSATCIVQSQDCIGSRRRRSSRKARRKGKEMAIVSNDKMFSNAFVVFESAQD